MLYIIGLVEQCANIREKHYYKAEIRRTKKKLIKFRQNNEGGRWSHSDLVCAHNESVSGTQHFLNIISFSIVL